MISYIQVEIKDGRYKSDSTKEKATACVGHGEIPQQPEGKWSLIARKGLGTQDINTYTVVRNHDDDYEKHAEIAASNMCDQMCSFIYKNLTV